MQDLQSKDFCPSGSKRKGDNMIQVIRIETATVAFECRTIIQADKWIEARRQLAGHDPSIYRIDEIEN